MDPALRRCLARHHDWADDGTCRRAGCSARKSNAIAKTLGPQPAPTVPGTESAPTAPIPSAIQRLRERVPAKAEPEPDPGLPAQIESDDVSDSGIESDDVSDSGKYLVQILGPAMVTGNVKLTSAILRRFKRKAHEPTDEQLDDAGNKASAWLKTRIGNGPKLGPFGQMVLAMGALSASLAVTSTKIETIETKAIHPLPPPVENGAENAETRSKQNGAGAPTVDTPPKKANGPKESPSSILVA